MLNLYNEVGDRNRAIQHYRSLVKLLAEELDAEPMPKTQALWQAIQTGHRPQPTDRSRSAQLLASFVVRREPAPRSAGSSASPPPIPLVGRQPSAWATTLAPLLPTLTDRLPYLPTESHPALLADALAQLFLQLSTKERPLYLILDDLQWADGASWGLQTQLAKQALTTPILIFGLCQTEELETARNVLIRSLERNNLVAVLALPRLSSAQTTELAHLFIKETDAALLQELYQESEGNPFFIVANMLFNAR